MTCDYSAIQDVNNIRYSSGVDLCLRHLSHLFRDCNGIMVCFNTGSLKTFWDFEFTSRLASLSLQDEDLLDIYRSAQDEAQHGLPIGPVREVAGAKGVLRANASNSSVLMFCLLVDSEDVVTFLCTRLRNSIWKQYESLTNDSPRTFVAVLQPLVAVEEQSFVLQGLLVTLALSSDVEI